jgi:putative addiction module component (TIGR02574 family)
VARDADRILGEALKLAPHERAMIVRELLATLEPDPPSAERTEAEWVQEIERRARASVAGSPGSSWAEARAQIESRLSHP